MEKTYTKKETDFWGNEIEVHYEGGRKVGKTKFRETFLGNKVQDHYNISGEKIGETRKKEGFFSDKAVHYDTDKNKIGYTKDGETFFGNKIQKHYDKSGKEVGKSRYEESFFGGRKKVHNGEYFKADKKDSEKSTSQAYNSDYGSADSYQYYSSAVGSSSRQRKETSDSGVSSPDENKSSFGEKLLKGLGYVALGAIVLCLIAQADEQKD